MKLRTEPKVCGVHCEGENAHTYIVGFPSPKLYRTVNESKSKYSKTLIKGGQTLVEYKGGRLGYCHLRLKQLRSKVTVI